jgi:putative oxidoreductase
MHITLLDYLFYIGRTIVGVYFLINAYGHLVKGGDMIGYAASKGVPSPKLAVYGAGILLLLGGLSFISGYYLAWGIVALIVFMIPVTFKMHAYWKETDPMQKMSEKISFQKNFAIIGFLVMFLPIAYLVL